jgi:MFS family permease
LAIQLCVSKGKVLCKTHWISARAIAIALILVKLQKGEVTSKKAVASLTEVREAMSIDKGIVVLIVVAVVGQFFNEFGNPYYFIFLESNLKASGFVMGLTQSMLSVGSVVVALPAGHLLDISRRRKPFFVLSSLLATVGVGLTAFAVSSLMVVASYFLFGLSNTLLMISLQTYFAEIAGIRKSLVFGAYQAATWVAGIPAPADSWFHSRNIRIEGSLHSKLCWFAYRFVSACDSL